MKFVLKGDFSILRNFTIVQGVYMYLQSMLDELGKIEFIEHKRELTFTGDGPILGYSVKIVENKNTKTITVIVK